MIIHNSNVNTANLIVFLTISLGLSPSGLQYTECWDFKLFDFCLMQYSLSLSLPTLFHENVTSLCASRELHYQKGNNCQLLSNNYISADVLLNKFLKITHNSCKSAWHH